MAGRMKEGEREREKGKENKRKRGEMDVGRYATRMRERE